MRFAYVIICCLSIFYVYAGRAEGLRRWELRTTPHNFLARQYNLEGSFRLTERFASGPSFVIYDSPGEHGGMLVPTRRGHAWGWQAYRYFDSILRRTWYFAGRAFWEHYTSYPHSLSEASEKEGFTGQVLLGHQWKWSRLLLLVGGGLQYIDLRVLEERSRATEVSRDSYLYPTFEAKLGIEF